MHPLYTERKAKYMREYYIKNKAKIIARQKKYYENSENLQKRKDYQKKYYEENK